MIDPITGAGISEALAALNAQMTGQSIEAAYNERISNHFDTVDGPSIGFADYTSDTPAISGDTNGSISSKSESDPIDAWIDYSENDAVSVSQQTGGVVSGSKVGTLIYSLVEDNENAAKAVATVAVPLDAAIVAIGQAVGVSIDAANLDADTKRTLAESYVSSGGVIYDKARELVTAWKDSLGRILFPKKALDSVYDVVKDWGGDDKYSVDPSITPTIPYGSLAISSNFFSADSGSEYVNEYTFNGARLAWVHTTNPSYSTLMAVSDAPFTYRYKVYRKSTGVVIEDTTRTVNLGNTRTLISGSLYAIYNTSFYTNTTVITPPIISNEISNINLQQIATVLIDGTVTHGGYPDGAGSSEASSYTPSTIPVAGYLATSIDTETEELGKEPLVPIHLTDDPYNSTGDTVNPTDPTDENNPGVINPPLPLPIPDTNVSNPDVPLVDSSVVDSTLVDALVEELANTLDPQAPQSSGIIPFPPLPSIEGQYPSIIPASGSGLIHVYNPTPGEMVSFGNWLWVTYADATIDKIWNNPFDGIIGAFELYSTPQTDGTDNIRSGFLTCPTTAKLVRQRYTEIDCGTVIVPEFYGNYLDYSPYSQAYIYLPFIGINEVSIDDIVGHAINIRYRIDAYNGSCIAMIYVAKNGYRNLCYQFAGNCAVEVPLAGGSQAAIKAGVLQAEAYARASIANSAISAASQIGAGIASGSVAGIVMGALGGLGTAAAGAYGASQSKQAARVANKSTVQHSGQFGASHGAMGLKIPHIIIRNPIQVKVVNYNDDYGFPAHKRVIVGGCRGYLRVREVNVISAHATDEEKALIEALLKNGVYVS